MALPKAKISRTAEAVKITKTVVLGPQASPPARVEQYQLVA